MRSSFDAVPIAIRISLAGVAGCICGFAFFRAPDFASLVNGTAHPPDWSLAELEKFLLSSTFYIGIAVILALPLILATIIIGVLSRRKIAKHPFVWSLFATVATWIVACAWLEGTRVPNAWATARSTLDHFYNALLSSDSMLILSGSLGAGISFYLMGLAHQRLIGRAQPPSV